MSLPPTWMCGKDSRQHGCVPDIIPVIHQLQLGVGQVHEGVSSSVWGGDEKEVQWVGD